MYRPVPREEIADSLLHLRGLFRRKAAVDERGQRAHERREVVTKNLLSNLFRTKDHPTLNTVLEVADIFSLTLDGAHRLFGYDLERVRDYDLRLNSSRTHVIESYVFQRDAMIDLPSHLGRKEAFRKNSSLRDLIASWQTNIPIRALDEQGWREPGSFYVRVGTQDSLGSSLPPGSVALVEPVRRDEALRPNPLMIYLLQFGNGYRCSRCVVSRGKLVLLSSGRNYMGTQEFQYPGGARVVGRIRAFATELPLLDGPIRRSLPRATRGAPLVLPWEHSSLDQLFAAKHLRFRRSFEDHVEMRNTLETIFHTRLHGRTERRYRYPTQSQPHVDTLLQLTLMNMSRYTDALRAHRSLVSDAGRFSLQTLLQTTDFEDLLQGDRRSHLPQPPALWEARRSEFGEWPSLLSANMPHPQSLDDRVIRLAEGNPSLPLEPPLSAGSLLVLDEARELPPLPPEKQTRGWARPLYALRRGTEFICGHLTREHDQYAIVHHSSSNDAGTPLRPDELNRLRMVIGVAVPV